MTLFEFMEMNINQTLLISTLVGLAIGHILMSWVANFKQTANKIDELTNSINELKDQVKSVSKNQISVEDDEDEDQEAGGDSESETSVEEEQKADSDTESEDETQLIKTLGFIRDATDDDLETIVAACSSKLLVPNWYTQKDFEELTDSKFSKGKWKSIVNKESNELIGQTSAMIVQWYDNKVAESMDDDDYQPNNSSSSESDEEENKTQLSKEVKELIDSDSESSAVNNETSESSDSEYEAKARSARNVIKNRKAKRFHFRIRKN
jgi:hypothetical protein